MKAVNNVLTIHIKFCYVCVKFKRTNQSCSPSKINQSINANWRTCNRNSKQFNACTQTAIRFFTAKYEILQLYPNGLSFFYSKIRNFENCTQTAIRFSQQNKKFSNVPELPFILWLQNTKFLKLLRNSHVLFDNKLKNLKLHPNCHSFFDDEIQNLKSYPNGHSFFY